MAPEALRGEPPDVRSDLYSLGVVLFALVTGALPVEAATIDELRSKHAAGERRHARDLRPDLSESLVGFLERALAPDPASRHQTAGDAESDLLLCFGAPAHSETMGSKRAPGRAADSVQHRLPSEVESFIGRESELGTLAERFERGARLVTLAGIGGIGKTRLAVRYAWENRARWPGGAWFCDLTEARTGDGIASAVGEAIGVPLSTDDVMGQLGRALAGRGRCLVILDNFEQIVDQAPETVGRWLEMAPEIRVLVTSRERLQLPGEEVLAIEALPIEEGMDLFVERGRRLRPITLESNEATSVRDVVRAVEGIPLAIELSAARLKVMTPAQIVARISERFRLLAGSGSGRHSTLRAAIDSSWELLEPWEKAAFTQAAVFEGGFSLEAAEGVLDLSPWPTAPWIVDVLQSLVDKNLLRSWVLERRGSNDSSPPAMRFGMFVSLQEYARERLGEAGSIPGGANGPEAVQRAEQRHGHWFARFGEQATIDALDLPSRIGRRDLAVEHENLIAACRRMAAQGNAPLAVKNCRAVWVVFQARGPFAPAVELGTTVLQLPLDLADRARMLSLLGQAKHRWGRLDAARADYEAAIALNRARGDRKSEGANLSLLSSVLLNQGKMPESIAMRMSALALHRETGDRRREGVLLGNLAISYHVLGRLEEANGGFEAALAIAREMGDRHAEGIIFGHLGNLRMEQGRRDEARRYLETAIAVHHEVGNRYFEGVVRANLGTLCQEQGDLPEAHSHLEAALAIHREVGNRQAEGVALGQLGSLLLAENRIAEAQSRLSEGEAILRSEGAHPYELATLLGSKADLEHQAGRASGALMILAEAEALAAQVSQGPETELGRKLAHLRQALGG
jgi:predicted ATPase/tetratricopeptide (TPR) repeat protein